MTPSATPSKVAPAGNSTLRSNTRARSPLAQLLHALNQPLTGLQCSMEVALASPRTPEQYVRGLREGLELTERMRALVKAIREVTDLEEVSGEAEGMDLNQVLHETVDDLTPVAEVHKVRITLSGRASACLKVRAGPRATSSAIFRLLDSALSLAARGTVLGIEVCREEVSNEEVGSQTDPGLHVRIRVRWFTALTEPTPAEQGLAEIGFLVAQATFEHCGAVWQRERTENLETITLQMGKVRTAGEFAREFE